MRRILRFASAAIIIGALLWPVLLGATLWATVRGDGSGWPVLVRIAASRICHQRPDRSFHTAGVQWPVCARCSGLYLGASIGALIAGSQLRRRRLAGRERLLWWLAIATLPTVVTIAFEWLRLVAVSNGARFIAALPLGAALAWLLAHTVASPNGVD